MKADNLRCENDVALYKKLQKYPAVIRVNGQIERLEADGPSSIRRNLLSTSVRLTKGMAPDIVNMADACVEMLGVTLPLEIYVYSSPQFNAACFKPEDDRLYVIFSSALLEGFNSQELKFVMGHELGHHVYDHHAIPIGHLLRGDERPDPQLVLELYAWSRYAEISADRAGAHCAQNMNAVARSLFKLSSGLTSKIVEFSLDDFVSQVDDLKVGDQASGQRSSPLDWFSTHPFSPLRVKALKLFERSKLYDPHPGATSKADLEVGVQAVLSLMEPSYLQAKTDTAEAMRRLLFAGLISVADASGGISEQELEVFATFFGKYAFTDKLNIEKIKQTLGVRIQEVKQRASEPQRMQVLHDMCTMVQSDGGVSGAEHAELVRIADGLGVSHSFICQSIDSNKDLD